MKYLSDQIFAHLRVNAPWIIIEIAAFIFRLRATCNKFLKLQKINAHGALRTLMAHINSPCKLELKNKEIFAFHRKILTLYGLIASVTNVNSKKFLWMIDKEPKEKAQFLLIHKRYSPGSLGVNFPPSCHACPQLQFLAGFLTPIRRSVFLSDILMHGCKYIEGSHTVSNNSVYHSLTRKSIFTFKKDVSLWCKGCISRNFPKSGFSHPSLISLLNSWCCRLGIWVNSQSF